MEKHVDEQQLSILHNLETLEQDQDFCAKFHLLMGLMEDIAISKGWHSPSKSFPEQILMLHTELSEVIEEYRKESGNVDMTYESDGGKPEGVPVEFGDVGIRLFDTCSHFDVDLLHWIINKAKFNLTRPNRHGNKKL